MNEKQEGPTPDTIERTIHFEDCGQDFLHWDLNANDEVVTSRPFQHSIWSGYTVSNIKKGRRPVISGKSLTAPAQMKYRIIGIDTTPRKV